MAKGQTWIPKQRLGFRVLAVLCCLVTVASVLPIFAVSFFNHPYYDDFVPGGQVAVNAWEKDHSIGTLLSKAADATADWYMEWEGNVTTIFFYFLQFGVISQSMYFLVTFIFVLLLACAWLMLGRALCQAMRASPWLGWLTAALMFSLSIHFVPHPNEVLFWYAAGVKYTLAFALLLMLIALIIRTSALAPATKLREGLRLTTMCLLAAGCATTNQMTALSLSVGLVFYVLYLWCTKAERRVKIPMTLVLLVALSSQAFNAFAPGTIAKQGITGTADPILSVVESITATIEYIGRFTTLPWIAALLLLIPLFYQSASSCGMRFSNPLLMLIGSFGVLASHLTPAIYVNLYYDSGRIVDSVYWMYCLFMLVNTWYWTGWVACRKETLGLHESPKKMDGQTGLPAIVALALAVVMAVGCAGYGLTKMTGGASMKALVTGQAARYDAAYERRTALLEAPEKEPVIYAPIQDVPLVFMPELAHAWAGIVNTMGIFYGKEILDGR